MSKKRKTNDCKNHLHLPPEIYEAEALKRSQKLSEAVETAIQTLKNTDAALSKILSCGKIFEGVENLDMDVSVIAFPDTKSGGSSPMMGFTWEWIDENDTKAMAEEIIEQVCEAVAEGELPKSADEFQTS